MEKLWPEHPLVHKGPVEFVEISAEKGRGVVAKEDIPAGTLVLSEKRFLNWPEPSNLDPHVAMLYSILKSPKKSQILDDVGKLHPVSLDHLPPSVLKDIRHSHLATYIKSLPPKFSMEGIDIFLEDEILRLFGVLRCSGVQYLSLSLINHADSPNCVRISPKLNEDIARIYSIREIKTGEELTVSYLHPNADFTFSKRSEMLKVQYGFENSGIDPELNAILEKTIPNSELTPNELTAFIKRLEVKIDKLYDTMVMPSVASLSSLRDEGLKRLSERHIVVMRINKLIVDISSNRLEAKPKNKIPFLASILEHSLEVLETQKIALPPLHPDFIQTFSDILSSVKALEDLGDIFEAEWAKISSMLDSNSRRMELTKTISEDLERLNNIFK